MTENVYPTIISFYTNTWKYPEYARDMKMSCDALKLESYIVERASTGDWLGNTRMKPAFIYETIKELKRPVLWIDVDGSIMGRPTLLKAGFPYDFAVRKTANENPRTWHVGTMYFNYTDACLYFLEEWNRRMKGSRGSDDLILDMMWKENIEQIQNLRIKELPKEYFEMLKRLDYKPSLSTLICHRASLEDSKMAMKKRNEEKMRRR